MHLAETVTSRCRLAMMSVLVAALAGVVLLDAAAPVEPEVATRHDGWRHVGQCVNGHWVAPAPAPAPADNVIVDF
jgi:hypothetical protein